MVYFDISGWRVAQRVRRVPPIGVTFLVSLLIHVALLWRVQPDVRLPAPDDLQHGRAPGSLSVRIAPPPSAPRAPPVTPPSQAAAPSAPAQRPRMAPRPRPRPPVIALDKPAPAPAAAAPRPTPVPRSADGDLASYIEARRRARAEPAPPEAPSRAAIAPQGEDQNARANRLAAANLANVNAQTFGFDPRRGGGIFQIERMGFDNAEFIFFGWNKDILRNTKQLIEVRRGGNSDIRIAVVRRMIAIIREHEQEDFLWESKRLGRYLTLSARARDNAGLEEFMMREFFEDARRP